MPPKATPAKKEAKSEESKGEDDGPARIVGPGELDDNGQPRPQDVLELVAARIKLEQSMKNRTELENDNHRLRDALERQAGEQTEIFAYLNKELSIKDKVITSMEARVTALEGDIKIGRREFDQQLMVEKVGARDATTKLAREVGKYEQELGDLNIFISRKTELEGELEDTKMELLKERKKHEQIITDLERKTVQEKERLRKEMETRIREAKETFMQMTDGQLEAGTKETMQQNEQMASEIAFQHRETERLVHRNKKLSEENLATRRELAMYRHAEAELSKRNHAYLKTIESLVAKLRALEEASNDIAKKRSSSDEIITSTYQTKVNTLQHSVEETLSLLEEMRGKLENKTSEVASIKLEREEMGFLVLQAAQEAKGHLTDRLYGQSIEESVDEGSQDSPPKHQPPGLDYSQQIRLGELKGSQRHQVLRYIFERVSDLYMDARKNIMPQDKITDKNVLFPRIQQQPISSRSLVGRGSVDSARQKIKTGGDHRSEGGRF